MYDPKRLVGERVQLLRKRKGLSQEELASQVGIDTKSLSRLERGAHFPSLETLDKIRGELHVELKDFFDFDRHPSAEEMRDFIIRSARDADYDALAKMAEAVKAALS
ncbi:helix-turn-helix domain-containing protein [Pseudoduganella sp. RAF53_2]|uniref:helix-turn-helix domain-containing protein n=1 Tax=unclassified Pseudoduganella TaxID=2637179 RepID=UPI003F9ABC36